MPEVFQTERRVEFRDTDAAGIVHFSVFFTYMEEAEHRLLRHLGIGVVCQIDSKTVSWPRVAAKCDYLKSIKFEQLITIEVSIKRIGTKSVTFQHIFRSSDQETIANGEITTVCCVIPDRSGPHETVKPQAIAIPDTFVEKLRTYLHE